MSGLYSTLNHSVKAITAHSRAIETAGKNLANVNNTTYARQRVVYGDRGTVQTPDGAESLGLEALGVQQLRDALIDRQVAREVSLSGYYEAQQSAYQRAQASLGQGIDRTNAPGSGTTENGIGAALDNFFNSFQSLASSPTDDGRRSTLLQNASILTDRLQLADQRLAQAQSDLDAQINTDVGAVNTLLATLADLNAQIGRFEINAPGSAVDLRDQRQAKIEELSARLPVTVVDSGGGNLQLTSRDGLGNTVVLLNGATVAGSVGFDGTNLTGGAANVALSLSSGSMQGALAARDGAVQTLRDDLDALARQIVTSVNEVYNPGGASTNFFNPAGLSAGGIALVAGLTPATIRATNGGAAGDNDIAVGVAQLASKLFSTGSGDGIDGTFSGFYSKAVAKIGQALAGATARVDDQAKIEKLVRSQRDEVSGVSLDEELADLMKFQRAFQASSRVFNIVDELLEQIVNRLGA